MTRTTLGIVIPVFHSTHSVARLIQDLQNVFDSVCTCHIYLIDDGNPDEIASWLERHCCGPHVTLIRLKNNYGQQNAILCGIRHSLGCRYIATMDDDLQHHAAMLLTLYRTIEEGYDIVYAAPFPKVLHPPNTSPAASPSRLLSLFSLFSRFASRCRFYVRSKGSLMRDQLFRIMLKLPDHIKVSSFRIMTAELAEEITRDASGFFYLSAAVFLGPRKAKTCFYEPRPRLYGKSGYTFWKLMGLYGNIIRFYGPAAPILTSKKRRQAMLYEELPQQASPSGAIMVLGGSNCQLHALMRARKEGCHVILADYTPSPPGAPYAHIHRQISTFDIAQCIKAAREEHVDAVMTMGTDQPVYTAACISHELGLPSCLTPEEALAVTNKKVMKQILKDHGIPTAPYKLIDETSSGKDLDFLTPPLVIKPLDSQGQRGIFKCAGASEILSHLSQTLSFSRCAEALVEQFYPSDEITVSGWVQKGHLTVLTVTDRLLYPDPVHIGICIGHRFPSVHMDRYEEIAAISQEVALAFGLKEGPFYLQLLIGREGIRVNELACRIGGAFEDVIIPWLTGFDILGAVMDLSFGRPVSLKLPKDFRADRIKKCAAVQLIFGRPGIISEATPLSELEKLPFLLDCGYNYLPGQEIPAAHNATARLGHGVIVGDEENIAERIDRFYQVCRVLSPEGKNLVERLYPKS